MCVTCARESGSGRGQPGACERLGESWCGCEDQTSVSTLSGVRFPCSPVLLGVGVFMCLLVRVFMSLLAAVVSTALLHWKYIV